MKPAICTGFDYEIPFPQALRLIRDAGFEVVGLGGRMQHADYTTREGRAAIQKLLEENDLTVDSIHAPFPEGDRLFSLDEAEREESIRLCLSALDTAAELDGKIVVIHLIQPYGVPEGEARRKMIQHGRESVAVLAEGAYARGVRLALENGQRAEYDQVLRDLLHELPDERVGLCYDSGHENVQGSCFGLLEEFGDRLLTVHIHDNRGSDTHVLPHEGNTDWGRFRKVFHGLEYSGNLLLEAGVTHSSFKDPVAFLSEARERAENLIA